MTPFHTESDCPDARKHLIGKTEVETFQGPEGSWLYRCPLIYPVNARHWRGPFASETLALADYKERTASPKLTLAEIEDAKRHGHHEIVDGVPTVMRLCPFTGATHLTSYALVPE